MGTPDDVHEPFSVTEIFAEGVSDVFRAGDIVHFTFTGYAKIPGTEGVHQVVVGKLAITSPGLKKARPMVTEALETLADEVVTVKREGERCH